MDYEKIILKKIECLEDWYKTLTPLKKAGIFAIVIVFLAYLAFELGSDLGKALYYIIN